MNWRNILERAGWTSIQSAAASIPVAQVTAAIADTNLAALEQLGLAMLGAAVGGFLSFVKTLAQERLAILKGRHEE